MKSVKPGAQPSQLAPSETVPPDLLDVNDELPITPDAPNSDKAQVGRHPVVRHNSKAPGLERVSMRTYGYGATDAAESLFPKQ